MTKCLLMLSSFLCHKIFQLILSKSNKFAEIGPVSYVFRPTVHVHLYVCIHYIKEPVAGSSKAKAKLSSPVEGDRTANLLWLKPQAFPSQRPLNFLLKKRAHGHLPFKAMS